MKKIITILLLFGAFGYSQAQAQYILGASYEVRSDEPTTGFGLHFQNNFTVIPMLLDVGFRFQTSFYNESYSFEAESITFERDDTSYDFGLSVIATAGIGLIAPYAGVGIGYEVFDRESTLITAGAEVIDPDGSDSGLYYYGAVGAGISAIPFFRPFVEYRYRGISGSDFMPSSYGTWAFGLQLRF
ncbi:hypothetical protein CYPRO_0070 [Cyclonatronum proteinivorum]|uniref:Outer membrane protein beta-barrel domain-containing protein n=1 Tax=Cyclonatronum proteinivorum TaxID=1457365 RepID=A0A345UFV7_9BACT|nr:hypothetical protein [Cyclonatronum proteinivorum]AXI99358.1 hypothetical protein CYPRO_0070 [Cyclonatronum proteinivorum]